MGFWSEKEYKREPTGEEWFADCNGDVLKMLEKVHRCQQRYEYVAWEWFIYMQMQIIIEQRKLLLTHKGSAAVSKTEKEGSSPFDSANPPVGAS
jgi:hypothetical protein